MTDATAAVDQLKGLKDDLKTAKSNAKDELKGVEEYYSKRRELMNKVAEASKLRGADTAPEMVKLISGAKEQVAFADALVLGATTTGELETAKKMLSAESEVLSKCEKLAKEQKEKAEAELKAIPKYEQAYLQLREARAEIATLPGATAQLQECDKLLATYRIMTSGEPASGYAEALKALEGKGAELLKSAQQKSQAFTTSEMDPDVQAELEKANGKLEVYAKNLPVYRTEGRKLAVAAAASEPDKAPAVRKLQELMTSMDQEILAADKLRIEAMDKAKTHVCRDQTTQGEGRRRSSPMKLSRRSTTSGRCRRWAAGNSTLPFRFSPALKKMPRHFCLPSRRISKIGVRPNNGCSKLRPPVCG